MEKGTESKFEGSAPRVDEMDYGELKEEFKRVMDELQASPDAEGRLQSRANEIVRQMNGLRTPTKFSDMHGKCWLSRLPHCDKWMYMLERDGRPVTAPNGGYVCIMIIDDRIEEVTCFGEVSYESSSMDYGSFVEITKHEFLERFYGVVNKMEKSLGI